MHRQLALVRRPSPELNSGLLSHIERQPIDPENALRQWEGYVAALNTAGWETIEVPHAPDMPDSVFVEDTVVVYGDVAVIARPGAVERQGEPEAVARVLTEVGYRVKYIEEPGTLDGGDVLKYGGNVWVGIGGRTNSEAVEQLAAHLADVGAKVISVPISLVLHLKSAVTALPDGTVIGYPPVVDDPSVYPAFLPVPEEHGGHVVLLGDDHVLMSTSAPKTAELLRDRGLQVTQVDISEFEKMEGCVTCLSVRLRG